MSGHNIPHYDFMTENSSGKVDHLTLDYGEYREMRKLLDEVKSAQEKTHLFLQTLVATMQLYGASNKSSKGATNYICELIRIVAHDSVTATDQMDILGKALDGRCGNSIDEELNEFLDKLETPAKKVSKRRAK
jgi:hypothetical protein